MANALSAIRKGSKLKAYLKARHEAVRGALRELKLDAILLTHHSDLAYLTDFTGEDSIGIVTAKEILLVTDFRFIEQAAIEAPWLTVVKRDGKMADIVGKTLLKLKVGKVGFEGGHTSFAQIHGLEKFLAGEVGKKAPTFIPIENVLVNIRRLKDNHEIAIIRRAVKIAEEGFLAMLPKVKPGVTENYLAGLLAFEMRVRGASDTSFPSIIATGANGSLPHYRPKEIPVLKNQGLLIDWGARYEGYCSDLTRTLLIGKVPAKLKEIYKVCLEANKAAIDFLKPGVKTSDADGVARKIIEKAGYGELFGHSLGHGIGRDIHENPRLAKTAPDEELKPGAIVTVEPGIYLPGVGGVRIEDDVLITRTGREVLSSLGKEIKDMQIG